MHTDSIFIKGSSHTINQDYSISGQIDNTFYTILSDGCSGSKDVDFGARLLVKSAEMQLKLGLFNSDNFGRNVINYAHNVVQCFSLDKNCLDATLLSLTVIDNKYKFKCFGDGALAKVRHDGAIEYISIQYPSGAPLYLSYLLDNGRYNNYKDKFGTKRVTFDYSNSIISVNEEICNSFEPYISEGSIDNYKTLIIFSDGLLSFVEFDSINHKRFSTVPIKNVLDKLLNFKGMAGEFVKRRYNGFAKEMHELNWKHMDDLSMGAISL
jgi:serine/threonine protein phosphatase PrpC